MAFSAGCDLVPASNPFDPGTPTDQQATATLRGTLVLEDPTASAGALADELSGVTLSLKNVVGDVVVGADGNPLPLPLSIDGGSATFGIELTPGVVRLEVAGIGARYTDRPTLAPVTIGAGVILDVGSLVFAYRPADANAGPGSIGGQVHLEGGNGAERVVQLFRQEGDSQTQVATTTTSGGAFSFPQLPIGKYALAASLDSFTPDYRVDVEVADADGQRDLDFADAEALTLHPVTAVLLPLLDRTDSVFYTRADSVPLAVLGFGGVTGMRLTSLGCDEPAPDCGSARFGVDDDAPFVAYDAAAEQALPPVEGRVGLFAQFEVRGDFVFTSPVFSTTVFRDTTLPEIRSIARLGAGPSTEIVATSDTVNLVIDADDVGGVAEIAQVVTVAGDPEPAAEGLVFDRLATAPGAASVSRTAALPNADGIYDVWFFVGDRAGNISLPASVRVRKDTAPAAAVPMVVDAVTPLDGRFVEVNLHFDATGVTALPVAVQLGAGSLPADTLVGRQDFDPVTEYVVDTTAVDGETLILRARLFDEVGNVTEVQATSVVALRGRIDGVVDLEQLGASPVLLGTTVQARGVDGSVLATTTTNATGAYSLPGVREGRVSLTATRNGHRAFVQELAFVEADEVVTVDSLLPLQRGVLVGSFRRADLDDLDGRHGGISVTVRLVSQTRQALPRPALTGANGDWSLELVPATIFGETWEVVGNADGYGQGLVEGVVVADNTLTVVSPQAQDPSAPTPVLLPLISGDFDLCSAVVVGGDCAPLEFTNQGRVRVHLRSDDGVTRIRASAGALPSESELPLQGYDEDNDVVVALPDVQGRVSVFVDLERDGGREILGPVQVFRDTVAPATPDLVIARGSKARRAGFTNEPFVAATVVFNEVDIDVTREAPLGRAPTFFANSVPTEPTSVGVALCREATPCIVLLPSLGGSIVEERHDLFAFACDLAGNCSASAGSDAVIYDETPPSGLHGVSLRPVGSNVVAIDADEFRTGSALFAVSIDVGTAETADNDLVVDPQGLPVADVDAVALSFVAAIDARDAEDLIDGSEPGDTAIVAGLPLFGGEADYDVFALFIDAAGNATAVEPNPFGFTLTLDETAPTGRLVLADGGLITNNTTVAARIDSLSENAHVKLVADAADCQLPGGTVDADDLPPTTTLADVEGLQLLIACLTDDVGNTGFASDVITLDRVAPTGAVSIDGGARLAVSRNLVASLVGVSTDVARVKVAVRPTGAAPISCAAGAGYVASASSVAVSIAADDPAGIYVVDACFEDAAGNRSATPASDDILFDTTPPVVTITINDDAEFTTSSEVRATIVVSDDVDVDIDTMIFANTTPSFGGAGEAFASTKLGLTVAAPTVEALKTVCVQITDQFGRTDDDCDDIFLDLNGPVGTLSAATFSTTAAIATTLRSDDARVVSAAVGENLDCAAASFLPLVPATDTARTVNLADALTEGPRRLVACFKDAAGNTAQVDRLVTFDPNDPALATTTAPTSGTAVSTLRPLFSWLAVPGAASFTLLVRQVAGGVAVLTQAGITGTSFTPGADLPQAELEWIVVVVKPSGRSSAVSFGAAARVTPDTAPPSAATGIVVAVGTGHALVTAPAPCSVASPCVNDSTPTLSFTAGSDALTTALGHVVQIANSTDVGFVAPVFSTSRSDGSAFDVPTSLEDGTYGIRVRSTDRAGNVATSATAGFTVDRRAPDVPAFLPLKDPVSSVLSGDIAAAWTSEGASGAVKYRFQLITQTRTVETELVGAGSTNLSIKGDLEAGGHVVHQVRVAAIDALGNQSAFAVAAFANDTTPPCGGTPSGGGPGAVLTILGVDELNAFSDSSAVIVEVACTSNEADPFDGPFRMQVGCNGTAAGKPIVGFTSFASCVLPSPDGTKSVQAVVFDQAGNATVPFADSIIVDRKDPTTPVLSVEEEITNDDAFSFTITEGSSDANFLGHQFIDGFLITSFDDPEAVVPDIAGDDVVVLDLPEERTYNVRVRGVDQAGNASPEAIARITLDVTNPTTPEIAGNDGDVVTNDNTFTFLLDEDSFDEHFLGYELKKVTTGPGAPFVGDGVFAPIAGSGTFTVALRQGATTTFTLRGVDAAGNVGGEDSITVIEDSLNPRPVQLAPLPEFTHGGSPQAFATPAFTSRGSYVDVHFERSDQLNTIDDNFDHFEVRASDDRFLNFVPLCAVATPSCPTEVRADTGDIIVGADHLILADETVVGFRIPLLRGVANTITLRSVDRAGNVSVETSVTTTEISLQHATDNENTEIATSLFGDRLAWVDVETKKVRLKEPGPDALFGSADDLITTFGQVPDPIPDLNDGNAQIIAQAPNLLVQTVQEFSGPLLDVPDGVSIRAFGPGPDQRFATTGDNTNVKVNDDPLLPGDDDDDATEPSAWGERIVWRRTVTAAGTDSDIMVREAGDDGVFFNDDDRVAVIADDLPGDPPFQGLPQVSGENVAFFQCVTSACTGAGDPRLVVVNSGGDRLLGTVDDVIRTLTQATNIEPTVRPQLYTPGTPGRAACRNVVAYAGKAGHKGVFVITTGPNGLFDLDDPPVQVMATKAQGGGAVHGFSLNDDLVVASDAFASPNLEVVTGGRDGCLTRTADNLVFDSKILATGTHHVVRDHRIVTNIATPTSDLVILELGAERQLWPRSEFSDALPNFDADIEGVALSGGGFYDLGTRRVEPAFGSLGNKVDGSHGVLLHATNKVGDPFAPLTISEPGADGRFGTPDDREVDLGDIAGLASGAVHALSLDGDAFQASSSTFSLDGRFAVWAGQQVPNGSAVVPVLRFAGTDGRFGRVGDTSDDCEVALSGAANGYKFLRSSQRRQVFQTCLDAGCGSPVGQISVREVDGDPCGAGVVTSLVPAGGFPDIDASRIVYVDGGVRVRDAGPDGRFNTLADNSDRPLSRSNTPLVQAPRISGDRVVYIDNRTATARVVIGDLADGSERVLSRSAASNSSVSIEGDLVVWGTAVADELFLADVAVGYLGLQPDFPGDARNPAPSRLRCPDDDIFDRGAGNDTTPTATPMNNGASVNGIACGLDEDRFAIDVPNPGCVVRARAHFRHADGDIDMSLLIPSDPPGFVFPPFPAPPPFDLRASEGSSDNELIQFTALDAGIHTLRVYAFLGNGENSYDVGLTVECPTTGAFGQPCNGDGTCNAGLVCDAGTCNTACTSDTQCTTCSENTGTTCTCDEGLCLRGPAEGDLRLVGGTNDHNGRLEVFANGAFGTVCDDVFEDVDATVACRQLGFNDGGTAIQLFGGGTGEILLDDVACVGSEARLLDCGNLGIGNDNCGHNEDVGISCNQPGGAAACVAGNIDLVTLAGVGDVLTVELSAAEFFPGALEAGVCTSPGNEKVLSFVAPSTGTLIARTQEEALGVDFDTVLMLRTTCSSAVAEVCDDDGFGEDSSFDSFLRAPVDAGTTYFLVVDAFLAGQPVPPREVTVELLMP